MLSLATGFGLGRFPFSGTLASVAACFPAAILVYAGAPGRIPLAILAAAASVACLALGKKAEAAFGGKDPSEVVVDEFAGMWLAFAIAPPGENLARLALALVLFRILDGAKPFGIKALQRFPGGVGILVDDLVAGALAGGAVALAGVLPLVAGQPLQ
ncbi:MAG: phosphatidylglycerophosphatase A [Planctomycetes bacterium]|nr:phosphatidylglycerophosphatase A [Planctomycetota bacterium]